MTDDVKLTETILPTGECRAAVFGAATAGRWAYGSAPEGKNRSGGNFWFAGGVIYSYGRHFPVARHVRAVGGGPPFVLLTTRTHSVTTATHVRAVKNACGRTAGTTVVFPVADVLADGAAKHRENLTAIRAEVAALTELARRAVTKGPIYLSRAADLTAAGNAYATMIGLPDRV